VATLGLKLLASRRTHEKEQHHEDEGNVEDKLGGFLGKAT
jgi:hypothetical protein